LDDDIDKNPGVDQQR